MAGSLSRRIVKVMGLFSGLQCVNIVCSIVKMKLVALWLHAAGVALFGIFQSAMETIAVFTDLGLRQSTVRDVAKNAGSPSLLARIATVVRRWSVLAGLLGATVMLSASPFLGKWFFGSYSRFGGFAAVAVAMFLNCLLYGEQSLLQGTGRLRQLAKASLWGTLLGLALSVPLFRWMGLDSVVLSIILYSLCIYGFTLLYRFRPEEKPQNPGLRQLWSEGQGFVRLGVAMSLAGFLTSLSHLAFIALLTAMSSIEEVGYFQAGDTLITRYIGLIFTAIGVEFFPRLVTAEKSRRRMGLFVNHEITLLLLVVTPVATLFIAMRSLIVEILYSGTFAVIIPFITLAVTSCVLKAASWCMAYCFIARGDGRTYVTVEGIDALISLPVLLLGYRWGGLEGIGWAYLVWYALYTLIVWIFYRFKYGLTLSRTTMLTILFAAAACAVTVISARSLPGWATIAIALCVSAGCVVPLRRLLR